MEISAFVCRRRAVSSRLAIGLSLAFASCTPAPTQTTGLINDQQPVLAASPTMPESRSCPGTEDSLKTLFLDRYVPRNAEGTLFLDRTHMGMDWQRDFIAVILDMKNGDLYWYDNLEPGGARLVKIPKGRAFFPAAYTKEKMLLIVCNAHFNTSAGATPTSISVPEANAEVAATANAAPSGNSPPGPPAAPAPQGASLFATNVIPKSISNYLVNPEARKPPPPAIPAEQPPTAADIKIVVNALEVYEKNYSKLNQAVDSWTSSKPDQQDKEMQGLSRAVLDIEGKAADALAQNNAYDQDAFRLVSPPPGPAKALAGPAEVAGNASFEFNAALNDAVQLAKDQSQSIGTTQKTLGKKPSFSTAAALDQQYTSMWNAIYVFANKSADVELLTTLITSDKWPEQEAEWRQERDRRIRDHQGAIKAAAVSAYQQEDPQFTSMDEVPPPKPLREKIEAVTREYNDLAKDYDKAIADLKSLVDTLNNDYAKSHVNIVIPVPSVSSNSLQLFTLSINDNLKPLQLTVPQPSNQDSDKTPSSCPRTCAAECAMNQCPASSPGPAPNVAGTTIAPSNGVGLQLSALKPGANPALPGNPVQVSEQTDGNGNIVITATFVVPFHRIVHFAAIGGFLDALIPSNAFTAETLPDTVVTTTTTSTTTTTGMNPGTTITQTIVPTTSTTTFAFQTGTQGYQTAGILGINWYPLGRDSFIVSRKSPFSFKPSAYTYSQPTPAHRFTPGLLFATAVNTAGTFVVAPEWDISPGISLFGGLALADKVSLGSGIVPCKAPGTSASTATYGPTTTSSGGTTVVTQVQVQTTMGCATPNATLLAGTTAPTTMNITPGFSFGIVFNSNLFSYFGGKN